MGLHTRLARIEQELLKLAKEYEYRDINFTTDNVSRDQIKLVIIAFAPGDSSVGIPDAQDSFVYVLRTQYAKQTERFEDAAGMPTGYSVELRGQIGNLMYGDRIVPIEDDDIRVCARDLGNIAARLLFNNDFFA